MGYTPPALEVRKIAGGWSLFPPDYTTTDDLMIYANGTDTLPSILLEGNGDIKFYHKSTGGIWCREGAVDGLKLGYQAASNYAFIYCPVDAKDIALTTTGTGVLRFGTYTASGDVAVNGSVAIKTADGVARKLATIA